MPQDDLLDRVRQGKLSDFTPDPNNANQGTERGAYMVRQSITSLGMGRSLVVDRNGYVIAGNKTQEAAIDSGLDDAIVVQTDGNQAVIVQRTDLDLSTDPRAKQLAIADNRAGEVSLSWDPQVLIDLNEEGLVDLDDFWLPHEQEELFEELDLDTKGEDDEEALSDNLDKAASGEIESRVSLGQIWACGRHRVACGDSTDEGNVRSLLGDRFGDVGMVWADAPYGISVVEKDGSLGGGTKGKYSEIIGDDTTEAAYDSYRLCTSAWSCPQIFWGANHFGGAVTDSSCWIVWDKQDGKSVTFADCELAWTNIKEPARIFKHIWDGFRRDSERGVERVHPTQKPIALCEWAFEKYGGSSDLIFDPFLGSAPSIIAAQQMSGNRTVYGFELSPEYCEVILRRYEQLTSDVAELVGAL